MVRSYLGHRPLVPASAYVDISAQVIGDVEIGEHSSVWMNAVVRGDANYIRIGERSNVQDCAVLHGMRHEYPVIIGSGVSIGHNAVVHGCTVEDNVLVGMGAKILNGAHIGHDSIIAAGALVLQRVAIPPRSLVIGHPARVKRTLTDDEIESIRMYTRNYLEYTRNYLAAG